MGCASFAPVIAYRPQQSLKPCLGADVQFVELLVSKFLHAIAALYLGRDQEQQIRPQLLFLFKCSLDFLEKISFYSPAHGLTLCHQNVVHLVFDYVDENTVPVVTATEILFVPKTPCK